MRRVDRAVHPACEDAVRPQRAAAQQSGRQQEASERKGCHRPRHPVAHRRALARHRAEPSRSRTRHGLQRQPRLSCVASRESPSARWQLTTVAHKGSRRGTTSRGSRLYDPMGNRPTSCSLAVRMASAACPSEDRVQVFACEDARVIVVADGAGLRAAVVWGEGTRQRTWSPVAPVSASAACRVRAPAEDAAVGDLRARLR